MTALSGRVATCTNVMWFDLVADRIVTYAKLVRRENVMAGTDCGFAQGALNPRLHPTVVWAKLRALSEAAALATKRLW